MKLCTTALCNLSSDRRQHCHWASHNHQGLVDSFMSNQGDALSRVMTGQNRMFRNAENALHHSALQAKIVSMPLHVHVTATT